MAFGMVTQEMPYAKSANDTFTDIHNSLAKIGKIKVSDQIAHSLRGSLKYGLQSIKVEASVQGNELESVISFKAKSDDVRGIGARKGLDRLIESMQHLDDPNYQVSKTGVSAGQWLYLLLGLIGILAFLAIMIFDIRWFVGKQVLVAVLFGAYFMGYYRLFKK
jgi:hypothetical protein